MKMQHCSISVTLTYTDDSSVKELVRPWQFTAAICFYILLTQLTDPPVAVLRGTEHSLQTVIGEVT